MKKSDVDLLASVARIKNRVSVKKYYYEELPKDIRSLAFTVSNLETLRQVELVKKSLQNAIEQGESFQSWKANLNTEILQTLSEARLETVYRTNTATVYNQSARYNAYTSGVTPYLMYTAVGDARTRESHLALDGVIKRADSKFWDKFTPPIDFNCRCGVVNLSEAQAKQRGIDQRPMSAFDKVETGKGFGSGSMGDVLSSASRETKKAIENLEDSPLRSRFIAAQDSIASQVGAWYESKKDIFN